MSPKPLPTFAATKALLPEPRFDDQPGYVDMYWKGLGAGLPQLPRARPGTGFVSQFIDAAFNQNIFAWDTCFMTMFSNVRPPARPGHRLARQFLRHASTRTARSAARSTAPTGMDYEAWLNPGKPLYSAWGLNTEEPMPPVAITTSAAKRPAPPSERDAGRARPPDLRLGRDGKLPRHGRQGTAWPWSMSPWSATTVPCRSTSARATACT